MRASPPGSSGSTGSRQGPPHGSRPRTQPRTQPRTSPATQAASLPAPGPGRALTLRAAARHPDLARVARVFAPASALLLAAALSLDGLTGGRAAPASGPEAVLGLLYGLIWWSLLEYLLHRFVLHWTPRAPGLRRVRRLLPGHRSHHRDPQDPDDVVSGRHGFALPLGASLLAGMLALGFPAGFALAALAGGAAGFAAYEFVHFACHQLPMASRIGRVLRHHHAIHHHRDETVNFGVTSPLWDHVFGTLWRPQRARADRSAERPRARGPR